MIALPKEHAGAFDTGFMLNVNPKLVKDEAKSLPAIAAPKASFSRFLQFVKNELDGYWGRPAEASVDAANAEVVREMDLCVQKMIPWLEQGKG